MSLDAETKPEPIQFTLTLRPGLGKQEHIFRVYEPIDLMLDGKVFKSSLKPRWNV